MQRANIYFSGHVQGVGFRYTVTRFARALQLFGWVRNLSDGRVEALVEGTQETITQLCEELDTHYPMNIREKQIESCPIKQASFSEFNIRF